MVQLKSNKDLQALDLKTCFNSCMVQLKFLSVIIVKLN